MNLGILEYELALHYAMETYVRRDILFIMSEIYGGKPDKSGNDTITLKIEHPEIEEWIKQQYENDEM